MRKIYHTNSNQKRAGLAMLILDKIDLKIKIVTGYIKGHFEVIKQFTRQEDITIIKV